MNQCRRNKRCRQLPTSPPTLTSGEITRQARETADNVIMPEKCSSLERTAVRGDRYFAPAGKIFAYQSLNAYQTTPVGGFVNVLSKSLSGKKSLGKNTEHGTTTVTDVQWIRSIRSNRDAELAIISRETRASFRLLNHVYLINMLNIVKWRRARSRATVI